MVVCATRSPTSGGGTSWESTRASASGVDKSVSLGGRQIDYWDEDPRILGLYRAELAQRGVTCAMPPELFTRQLTDPAS